MELPHLSVVQADITTLDVDAIVNAADPSLLGGGGVDGAIHRAAGPELLEYCRTLGGCPTGQAKISPGFRLKARHIIHTVGPVWHGGEHNEDALLADCYRNSLALAAAHGLKSIAFPGISTGVYRFPLERAAMLALKTVMNNPCGVRVQEVTFVCFSTEAEACYRKLLADRTNLPS